MSLFEYAQEVVSRKLERKEPMLSVSMGMQPVMPMAQGGGLSSVQNSLNINGQPHRLAYINPNEEDLLKSLGGSGRKIDGIPAYDDSVDGGSDQGGPDDGIDDSVDGGSNQGGPDDGIDDSVDGGSNQGAVNSPSSPTSGYGDTFDMNSFPDISPPDNQNLNPYFPPPDLWDKRDDLNRSPNKTVSVNPVTVGIGAILGPAAAAIANAFGIGKSMSFDISIPGTGTKGGYGDTGTGNQGGGGNDGDDTDDGTDAGGDDGYADYIIKEKIAEVKQIPVEEVTVEEVKRAKRLTAAQRVAGTRLEDILDDIYGSGKGSELLSLAQSGGGIASLQKNININGQPHQLSYINPSEENLLKQLGGSGEKVNGIPAYMMSGDNSGNAAGTDAANASAAADAANAAQDAAMGQVGGDVIPPEAVAIVPAVPEVIVPEVVEDVPKEPKVINKNLENILATSYPNLSPTEIARMLGGVSKEADPENNFETDAKIIEILKEEGNPFPTPDDIKKFKSESNMKSILPQVYGNSNLLNNTGIA